jgi:hypothetical protein
LGYILLFIHLFPHREIGGGFLVLGVSTDLAPDPVKLVWQLPHNIFRVPEFRWKNILKKR